MKPSLFRSKSAFCEIEIVVFCAYISLLYFGVAAILRQAIEFYSRLTTHTSLMVPLNSKLIRIYVKCLFLIPLLICSIGESYNLAAQSSLQIIPGDGVAGDFFGTSVSLDGEYAIIGASRDDDNGNMSGAAYIFQRDGAEWIERTKITPGDPFGGDEFGEAVAISGDVVIIGSIKEDDMGSGSGAVYIFQRFGTIWSERDKLSASDGSSGDQLGFSVSIDGNVAVAGAYLSDSNGNNSGSAYVFEQISNEWTEVSKLQASDGAEDDFFGYSISLSNEFVVVGAYQDDDNGPDSGSAYFFEQEGSNWVQREKLTSSDGASGDEFGVAVAVNGSYVIVGSHLDDDNGVDSGSAYVFERQGASWVEIQKLVADDGEAGDGFGVSVAIDGEYILIGAHLDDDGNEDSGSAYLFQRQGSTWVQINKFNTDARQGAQFGGSVSISGDYSMGGAERDNGRTASSGSVTVFQPVSPNITSTAVTSGIIGEEYMYQLEADGFPPPTYSLQAAPPGMQITDPATGVINWTPTSEGNFFVTAVASNSQGSDEQSFTVSVSADLQPPIITTTPNSSAIQGEIYIYDVDATGNPLPNYSLLDHPEGMIIDTNSGIISWSPSQAGMYSVTVEARNSEGMDQQSFTLAVTQAEGVPTLTCQVATEVTPRSAILSATVDGALNTDLDIQFEFGTDTSYGSVSAATVDSSTTERVYLYLSGLDLNTVYFYRAVSTFNGMSIACNGRMFETTPYPETITIERMMPFEGDIQRSESFRMISLPGRSDMDIADTFTGTPGTDWNVFLDNGNASEPFFERYIPGDPSFRFQPGRGYWALANSAWTIDQTSVSTVAIDPDGFFLLPLNPGWNLIGNPFDINVTWESIRGMNDFLPENSPLYDYNGVDFVSVPLFRPYKGYYLFNGSTPNTLQFPFEDSISKTAPAGDDRRVLTLSLISGERLFSEAHLDLFPESSVGLDRFDHEGARSSMSRASIRFVPAMDDGSKLIIESRPGVTEGERLRIEIHNTLDMPLTLKPEILSGLQEWSVILIDLDTGLFTDLHIHSEITISHREEKRSYELLIGPEQFIEEERALVVPDRFSLSPNYPNPFSESTTIGLVLSNALHVTMEVYDVLGRRVQVLVDDEKQAGRHHVKWDGQDELGRRLPAGVYFTLVRLGGEQRVLSMIKLE